VILESFRGDFDQVASLIQRSWAENPKPPFLYTPEVLSSFFDYPGTDIAFSPALYDGPSPVAFIAGFPRRVRLRDREARILISALLSVAPEKKRMGYGLILWSELVKRARAGGFDGMMSYCVEGDPMDHMILAGAHRLSVPVERSLAIPYLARPVWPKAAPRVDAPDPAALLDGFLQLTVSGPEQAALSRVWSRSEAEWQCAGRTGAIVASLTKGGRRGMLTGYVMQVADLRRTKCLLVEDVLWGDLGRDERTALLGDLMVRAAAEGVRIATVPVLNYSDLVPFQEAGFRPAKRTLNAYLSIWDGRPPLGTLSSMYLDVF